MMVLQLLVLVPMTAISLLISIHSNYQLFLKLSAHVSSRISQASVLLNSLLSNRESSNHQSSHSNRFLTLPSLKSAEVTAANVPSQLTLLLLPKLRTEPSRLTEPSLLSKESSSARKTSPLSTLLVRPRRIPSAFSTTRTVDLEATPTALTSRFVSPSSRELVVSAVLV